MTTLLAQNLTQLQRRRSPIEPFLFLYITEKCQLRCTHCYMGDRLDHERYMSPALVREILSSLRVAYGQYKVYLLGGEPTTHPALREILQICREEEYRVVITSNGLISELAWRALQRDNIDSFSFSMDGGTMEAHERMRGRNTFAPLLRSIKRAVASGFQTRAIMTVTEENLSGVSAALDLAESLDLSMISFHYFTPTGAGTRRPDIQLTPSRWIEFCDWLREESAHRSVRIFYPPAFLRADDVPRLSGWGYRGCTARNLERYAIFPDRRVYICSAFFDTDLHYGTFEDGRIIPRFAANGTNELTLVSRVSANCRGCSHGSSCGGGCAAYDYFHRTHTSDDCDRTVVPVCPLWSVPAEPDDTHPDLQDLR